MGKAAKRLKGKPTGRIANLRCYETVHDMVCAGYPLTAIANLIQDKMQEYLDVPKQAVVMALHRYRESLKDSGDLVQGAMPRVFVEAKKKFSNKMQELERLEDMILVLQYRIDLAHGVERIANAVDPGVDRMTREFTNVVARMHDIKMDLGLVGSRDIGTITVSAERLEEVRLKYGDNAAKAYADPVSRNRVLAAIGAIRKVSGDKSVERLATEMGVSDPDGAVIDAEFTAKEESVAIPVAKDAGDVAKAKGKPVKKTAKKPAKKKAKIKPADKPVAKEAPVEKPAPVSVLPPGPEKPKIKR